MTRFVGWWQRQDVFERIALIVVVVFVPCGLVYSLVQYLNGR